MTQNTSHKPPVTRLVIGLLVLLLMAGALVAALYFLSGSTSTGFAVPRDVSRLELTRSNGETFTFEELRGQYTLLSFGYTHCPDVCPLTLTEFLRVKRELTEDEAEKLQFAFVSVDGERDTPELLNRYVTRFDPVFFGITTADDAVMQQVADGFNVFYEKRAVEGTQTSYMVDHTASLFLLGPRGDVVNVYSFGTPAVEIAEDIQSRL